MSVEAPHARIGLSSLGFEYLLCKRAQAYARNCCACIMLVVVIDPFVVPLSLPSMGAGLGASAHCPSCGRCQHAMLLEAFEFGSYEEVLRLACDLNPRFCWFGSTDANCVRRQSRQQSGSDDKRAVFIVFSRWFVFLLSSVCRSAWHAPPQAGGEKQTELALATANGCGLPTGLLSKGLVGDSVMNGDSETWQVALVMGAVVLVLIVLSLNAQ